MKRLTVALMCVSLAMGIVACGSSSASSSSAPAQQETSDTKEAVAEAAEEVKEETAETPAETPAETAPVEEKAATSWEVGEGKVQTWTDSIGSEWVQVMVPVVNNGTDNLYLSSGTMDLEDETGHLVKSMSMVSVYPTVIKPGETAYYYEETTLDEGVEGDLTVLPHVAVEKAKVDLIRYEVSDLELKSKESGGVELTGRVENTTQENGSLVYIVAFFYNEDNEPLGQAFTILNNDLAAGDKIGFSANTFSLQITADEIDHYDVFAYPTQMQF